MNILMLGATGRTGKLLLQQALERGHTIHAVIRDARKLIPSENLVIFEGSPSDKILLEKAIQGCNAVLSTLNISRTSDFPWAPLRSPRTLLSDTMKNLLVSAANTSCKRIIVTTAWGVNESKKEIPGWFRWFIDNSNIRYPYIDHGRVEELLRSSELQWTVIRPAGLTNSRKIKKIIVSKNGVPRPALTISRSQVAGFMLDVLEQHDHVREMVTVSSR